MTIRDAYETTFDEKARCKTTTSKPPECSGQVRSSGTESDSKAVTEWSDARRPMYVSPQPFWFAGANN